jgi:hypothetical protein
MGLRNLLRGVPVVPATFNVVERALVAYKSYKKARG